MQIVLVRESTTPLHVQLLDQLRHLILSGAWPAGSRLPSEARFQQELGISRSTVRQALNQAEHEGLIERIPGKGTFVAQTPPQGPPSALIGYITFDFLTDFQRQLLDGAERAARAKGYRILFSNSNQNVDEENRLLDRMLLDGVRGLLIWPALDHDPSRRLFQLSRQRSVPIVCMDRILPGMACDHVSSDNYRGAYAAVSHLLALGHEHIVFLSRPILHLEPVAERLRGYRDALRNAGRAPYEPWLVGAVDQEVTTGEVLQSYKEVAKGEVSLLVQRLQEPGRPTAIFAMNDLMAILAYKAALLAGLRIPDDLSLVGFDDMDIVAHLQVPLTTVAQDTFAMGYRAAEMLIERMEGYSGPSRHEILPTQLRVRASTGPVPAMVTVTEPASRS